MALVELTNADLAIQSAGTVVRAGIAANSCNLAQADSVAHLSGLLGIRLDDVAPAASGTLAGFNDGIVVRLEGSATPGDPIYLSATTAGVGTNVAPSIVVPLGIGYNVYQVSGIWYAQLLMSSYIPQVPVPPTNSPSNVFEADVVGNKTDDEQGSSAYSKVFRTDRHDHSAAMVYPSMTGGVAVTKDATPWTLGAFAVVIPAATIADAFDIHGINFDAFPTAGVYEIVLYSGPDGGEVEIGRARFTRLGTTEVAFESPFMCPIQSAGSQIKAKLAGSNASASVVTISLRMHTY